jgi:hypothetical protein
VSNELAIATVTAALGYRLDREVVQVETPGGSVTNVRPNAAAGGATGLPTVGINIFLYQATPNLAQRNADAPTRRSDGTLVRRPAAALDLHYMLSFYGDETRWEPQILLGSTVRTLHAEPALDRALITEMLTSGSALYTPLLDADLASAPDLVRFMPTALTFEEMSKLWGIFYQIPYVLSVAYIASAVVIETTDSPAAALPVRRFHAAAVPLQSPVIESASSSAGGAGRPLTTADQLVLLGHAMQRGISTTAVIDSSPATIASSPPPTDTAMTVVLPATLLAGVHTIQLLEQVQASPSRTSVLQSNETTFALAPTVNLPVPDAVVTPPSGSIAYYTVDLTVSLTPNVDPIQQIQVALVAYPGPGPSYTLDAQERTAATGTIQGHVQGLAGGPQPIASGTYLLRVMVDGIPSFLGFDAASPHAYNSPTVVVP